MDDFDKGMEALWENDSFREAVVLSNPAFMAYQEVPCFCDLPIKWQFTLWKYANRMCYRSTPLGSFTGMGMWKWTEEDALSVSQEHFEKISLYANEEANDEVLYRNRLAYSFGKGTRYYRQLIDGNRNPWKMMELPEFPFEAGEDPLSGLSEEERAVLVENGLLQKARKEFNFDKPKQGNKSEAMVHTCYYGDGSLDSKRKEQLLRGIRLLIKLSPVNSSSALKEYKEAFRNRFEYHGIPILHALDPDIGIEYSLERSADIGPSKSLVHSYLMEKWLKAKEEGGSSIEVCLEDLTSIREESDRLPENMVVMFNVMDSRICIKHISPLASIPLIARMAPFDGRIRKMIDAFVLQEQRNLPNVIHADVIYQGEQLMRGISLHQTFRSHQLLLDPVNGNFPDVLEWNDLVLKLDGEELILFSLKYQKRVMPHFNSAYNPRRDRFPLFRLLADLQYEGISVHSTFNLSGFFPGQEHYPRVCSGELILQPAMWVVPKEILKRLKSKKSLEEKIRDFEGYASNAGLPDIFLLPRGDQGLVFSKIRQLDLEVFFKEILGMEKVTLQEWLYSGFPSSLRTMEGKQYAHEFLGFCFHKQATEKQLTSPGTFFSGNFVADPSWITFQVYMQVDQQDRFLIEELLPFVMKGKGSEELKWFFMRYKDERGTHLRVRIADNNFKSSMPAQFWQLLTKWQLIPYVRSVSLHPYFPERSRYASMGMRKTECLFQKSSEGILLQGIHFSVEEKMTFLLKILYEITSNSGGREEYGQQLLEKYRSAKASIGNSRLWDAEFRNIKLKLIDWNNDYASTDPFISLFRTLLTTAKNLPGEHSYWGSVFHMQVNRMFAEGQLDRELACYYMLPKMTRFFLSLGFTDGTDGKRS